MLRRLPAEVPNFLDSLKQGLKDSHGINSYTSKMQNPHSMWPKFMRKKQSPLNNFQWVQTRDFRIARCAQPNYNPSHGKDEDHEISHEQLAFIISKGIRTIISLNRANLSAFSRGLLNLNSIKYYHIPVKDFHSMKIADFQRIDTIVNQRKSAGAALFYCGFGEGRTGMAIAGWACKYLLCKEHYYFSTLHFKQFGRLMKEVFGVEKGRQVISLMDYVKSFADVQYAHNLVNRTPLSQVNSNSFVDAYLYSGHDYHVYQQRPASRYRLLYVAPPSNELPRLPYNSIPIQSLDPVGELRWQADAHMIQPVTGVNRTLLLHEYDRYNPNSLYYHDFQQTTG